MLQLCGLMMLIDGQAGQVWEQLRALNGFASREIAGCHNPGILVALRLCVLSLRYSVQGSAILILCLPRFRHSAVAEVSKNAVIGVDVAVAV